MIRLSTGSRKPCGSSSGGRPFRVILIFCIFLSIGLLFVGLSTPFDGFHGFQEAWYATIARNYSSHSFLFPTGYDEFLDLYLPPLFSYLLYASFSLFGPSEAAARIVPILFSLISIVGVYLLGNLLMKKGAGLEAAALFASTPIFLVLGRNVQTDIVYVAFSLFSIYFYIRARRSERTILYIIAGIFLGMSLFTKQFAIITGAAIFLWEVFGPERKRLLQKRFLLFAAAAGLIIAPYYGYHLVHDPAKLISDQLHGSASKAGLATGPAFSFLLSEMLWACSPLFLVGSLAGFGFGLLRAEREKFLPALMILLFFVFFLFFHRHSYYCFGMVPFLSLCFPELSARLSRRLYSALVLAAVLSAIVLSAYTLAGSKYGRGEFKAMGTYLGKYNRPVLLADTSFYYNYAWLFKYYCKNAVLLLRGSQLSASETEALKESDGVFELSDIPVGARAIPITGIRYGLRVKGRVYVHVPPNFNFFAAAAPTELKDYKIIWTFGPIVKLEQTSFFLVQTGGVPR